MSRRIVATEDCDTFDEVRNMFQGVVDDAEQTNAKVCQLATPGLGDLIVINENGHNYPGIITGMDDDLDEGGLFDVEFLDGDAGVYGVQDLACNKLLTKPSGADGFSTITAILMVMLAFLLFLLVGTAKAVYVATDINSEITSNPEILEIYLRDVFANQTSSTFIFTPRTEPGSGVIAQGMVYFDSSTNVLNVSLDGSAFSPIDTAGGVSLDGAYDFGSSGGGRSITVDSSAVTLTSTDAANNVVFAVDQADTAGAVAQTITSAGTGALLSFDSNGTGADILGSDSAWTITKAGKGTFNGGGEIDTADFLFDATSAGKDLEWDDSQFALHFLDNTILAIGGATTAAGDFTFAYDGTDLNLEAAAANDDYRMGETTHFNLVIHGETNTNEVTFDTDDSALVAIWDGFKIRMNDNDLLLFGDSSEFTIDYDEASTDNLIIVALNANDAVQIGDGSTGTDFKAMGATSGDFLLFDASADELFFEDVDLKINEGSQLEFAWSDNGTDWTADLSTEEVLTWLPTETTDDQSFNIGNATNTSDVRIFGENASTVVFDSTGDEVLFNAYDISMGDGDIIRFGDGDDITIAATGTTTTITLAAGSDLDILDTDNSASKIILGLAGGTHGLDITINTITAGEDIVFDAAAKTLKTDGVDITIEDDDILRFGDAGDVTMNYDEDGDNDLQVTGPVTFEGVVEIQGSYLNPVEILVTTEAVEITDSGKVFILNHATEFASTLPTVASSAGVTFRFIVGVPPDTGSFTVVTDSLEDKIHGVVTVNGVSVGCVGLDTITFTASAALVGDWIELTSDGVFWYLSGAGDAASSIVPTGT